MFPTSVRSFRAADWVIAFVLLGLVSGPAMVLAFADRPGRFGFQMYSGYGEVTATWQDKAGKDHSVDLSDHLAEARWDIDWTEGLPTALCARLDDAASIEVRQLRDNGLVVRRVTC